MDKNEYMREYYQKNREKILERQREYNREYQKTEQWEKIRSICRWKRHGIIPDSWDAVYKWYLETERCGICDCVLTTGTRNTTTTKCLDHDHSITDDYNIRGVICISCNSSETSIHKYIAPRSSGYQFQRKINGKKIAKHFKTLEEAIAFRDAFDIKDYSPV